MRLKSGRGYVSADKTFDEDLAMVYIPIDSVHSPVRNVNFAVEAARLRLRPILMTSLAFIFGVSPMVWAVGAGAELRQTLGTAVFSGMIGVTLFGLIFTPVFYVVTRWIAVHLSARRTRQEPATQPTKTDGRK